MRPALWSGCRSEGTGWQMGIGKCGEKEHGETRMCAGEQGRAQLQARQAVPIFLELEALKGHMSLQREEVETQAHPGHLSTDIAQAGRPPGPRGMACLFYPLRTLPSASLASGGH